MRLVTHLRDGRPVVALVDERDTAHDLSAALGLGDLVDAIERDAEVRRWAADQAPGTGTPLDELQLLAPFPRPRRGVFCVGKNYLEHVDEVAGTGTGGAPAHPIVFTKPPSAVVGPGADVESHPALTSELDYEAELAVVIGVGGRDISRADAAAHVWGYTIVDDISARDRQRRHGQWFLGKGLDTSCPMGPFAVSADEVDPGGAARPDLRVTSRVNGELRQDGRTSDLIFDIPTLIETISAGLTLEPGDVIATGTPSGVGAGFEPPRFLAAGDVVEIEITGLGVLRNTVV